jgi:acyl carrier protein
MDKKEILKLVLEAIKKEGIKASEADINKNFKELNIDSLKMMQIIVDLEEQIGKQLSNECLTTITSLSQLVDEFKKITK